MTLLAVHIQFPRIRRPVRIHCGVSVARGFLLSGSLLAGHDGGMRLPSYASGVSEVPLLGETIGENLSRTVAEYGDREALVEVASGRRWTYAEFGAEVDTFARGLMARGIAKGDRVGIWAPNCAEWTISQYATAAIGAILVNINPAYRTHELAYALNQSGVKVLISATEFKASDYRKMVDEVRRTGTPWSPRPPRSARSNSTRERRS
jgi:fatty-acyl-CoA synthase